MTSTFSEYMLCGREEGVSNKSTLCMVIYKSCECILCNLQLTIVSDSPNDGASYVNVIRNAGQC